MSISIADKLMTADDSLRPAVLLAQKLHGGVSYGQSDMLDQVLRVAEIVYDATGGDSKLTGIALMHKAYEAKRIKSGAAADPADVEAAIGPASAAAVREFQDFNDATDKVDMPEKVRAVADLSPAAQVVLMAEKVANFETSIERPNPKKPPEWHANYFQTRIEVARAAAPAHAGLSAVVEETYKRGVDSLQALSSPQVKAAAPEKTARPPKLA